MSVKRTIITMDTMATVTNWQDTAVDVSDTSQI